MKRMMDVPKIRRILAALCLVACGLAPASFMPPAIAAGVRLSPTLENGKTLTYEIARTLKVEQTPAAEPGATTPPAAVVSTSELEMVVRLDVGSVRADGTTEVGVQVQSLRISLDPGGGAAPRTFAYPAEEAEKPKDDAEEKAESALDMAGTALAASKPRIVINREGGLGDLLGMDALGMAIEAAKKADRTVSRVELASLDPEALRQMLAPIFLPAAPEPASRVFDASDTWTVRRTSDLGQMGSLVIDERWTAAARGADGMLSATAQAGAKAEPPRGIVTAAPTMEIEKSSGVSSLKWDSAGASLAAFSRGLDVSMKVALGDISMKQTQSSSLTITRKD
jgi:hypothetical protein